VGKALTVVFQFDAAADAEFLEDGHHLADGQTGNLRGAAQRGFALFVFLDGQQYVAGSIVMIFESSIQSQDRPIAAFGQTERRN